MNRSILCALLAATLAPLALPTVPAANAQDIESAGHSRDKTVSITPIGQRTGEFCALDRALLFEDPTGVRILYDPGVTVAGGGDPRLGGVDAILVSHNHYDHIGYRKQTQNPDDPHANCDGTSAGSITTANTNTAEIAAAKNSVIFGNTSMVAFLSQKIRGLRGIVGACPGGVGHNEVIVPASLPSTCTASFGSTHILTHASGIPGVQINVVAAQHNDGLVNTLLLLPADGLGKSLNDNGLNAYDGLASGFVLTFTNGLKVYLTGDTGPTSDMFFIVNGIYHPNLTVANVDGLNSMGAIEGAYAMKELVHTSAVIPSHAEVRATADGKLLPGTETAKFIRLLGNDIPAYLPLSGRTMQFDGNARCVAGCEQH